eukprot:scaffold259_cov252-Pinguiococcus_pyrenoidosus.AAC.33
MVVQDSGHRRSMQFCLAPRLQVSRTNLLERGTQGAKNIWRRRAPSLGSTKPVGCVGCLIVFIEKRAQTAAAYLLLISPLASPPDEAASGDGSIEGAAKHGRFLLIASCGPGKEGPERACDHPSSSEVSRPGTLLLSFPTCHDVTDAPRASLTPFLGHPLHRRRLDQQVFAALQKDRDVAEVRAQRLRLSFQGRILVHILDGFTEALELDDVWRQDAMLIAIHQLRILQPSAKCPSVVQLRITCHAFRDHGPG